MSEEHNWLEVMLRRKAFEETPIKVLNVKIEDNVVSKGDNYSSVVVERWKVRVLLGSGQEKIVSLIMKKGHVTEDMAKMSRVTSVFVREITMYRDILPKMEQMLEDIEETDDIPFAKCVHYRLYNQLVFEDLRAQGYRMMEKKKQLGLEYALLVMKQLGKFHALTRMLLVNGEVPMVLFGKHVWYFQSELVASRINESLRKFYKLLEDWGGEWTEVIDKIKNMSPDFATRYLSAVKVEPNEFAVLNHGDCWTNNMMFRVGDDLERPTSVKFIDFQISFVCTPAKDLTYVFNTSVTPDVRKQHTIQLLETYRASLNLYLTKLGYTDHVPTVEEIEEMIRKKAILEFGDSFMICPFILGEPQEGPDVEDVVKAEAEAIDKGKKSPEPWNMLENMGERVETIVKMGIQIAKDAGLI